MEHGIDCLKNKPVNGEWADFQRYLDKKQIKIFRQIFNFLNWMTDNDPSFKGHTKNLVYIEFNSSKNRAK